LLEVYGIPVAKAVDATSAAKAAAAAKKLGFPVVLKVLSPQITHKTDVGGVELNLRTEDQVEAAFKRIVASAKKHVPDADVQGVTVEPMIKMENAFELIVGVKRDPTFGSVIMVGTGGVAAEVIKDRALGLPPLNERLVRRMLEALRVWPLLKGYRGRPGADIDKLIEVLIRFSYLVTDHPDVAEFDINPLLVSPKGVMALDARAMISPAMPVTSQPGNYPHLAISPYPEQYITRAMTIDGRPVTLRPIKSEDEPLWLEMLHSCSEESIRMRFFSLIGAFTHEMAVRYCVTDYDRELALVAETEHDGKRTFVGVGRLEADPDHHTAEYAVLIPDAWQRRGIGAEITDVCLRIAKDWGIRQISAVTMPENDRMIAIFKNRGFKINKLSDGTICGTKKL